MRRCLLIITSLFITLFIILTGYAYAVSKNYKQNRITIKQDTTKSTLQIREGKMNYDILRYSKEEFNKKFKNNTQIPKTKEAIIDLARKIYTYNTSSSINECGECGESVYGNLFASLSNPDIGTDSIEEILSFIEREEPSLPEMYLSEHFKFYFTTNDSNKDNNVTRADIEATAKILENAWNNYSYNFKEPKYYVENGKKLIDIKVYYLDGYYGSTVSNSNYINLNSKYAISDSNKRQTTPVHELFHRVQYNYGYTSGTADSKWLIEGTASWVHKYMARHIGDWLPRMNDGLNSPDIDLIKDRTYNAVHFWCYLGQKAKNEQSFIKEVFNNYSKTKDNISSVDLAIRSKISQDLNFDTLCSWWMFTNFFKDTDANKDFDYEEDELKINNYGPLSHVPRTTNYLTIDNKFETNSTVTRYGADYYVFNLSNDIGFLDLCAKGKGQNFGYAAIELSDNKVLNYQLDLNSQKEEFIYKKEFQPGSISQIVLIVMGNPSGGEYTITANSYKNKEASKRIVN